MNLQEFNIHLRSRPHPVIVDFWAPWCAPCHVSKPILESLAREYTDKVDLLLVNADEHPQLLQELKIYGIPTILATRSGEILQQFTGVQSRENYRLLFEALAEARETVTIPMPVFDRFIRLLAGSALALIGFQTATWYLIILGGLIAFLGVYDRCPIWRALTGHFKKTP